MNCGLLRVGHSVNLVILVNSVNIANTEYRSAETSRRFVPATGPAAAAQEQRRMRRVGRNADPRSERTFGRTLASKTRRQRRSGHPPSGVAASHGRLSSAAPQPLDTAGQARGLRIVHADDPDVPLQAHLA